MTLQTILTKGEVQYGLWVGLANEYTTEICAGSGADWILIDGEHAPNTLTTVLAQLQAARGLTEVIVRAPDQGLTGLKQYLDLGAQNLMIPKVESAEQAALVVSATRFPPTGTRGVASTLNRAADFGRHADYLSVAHESLCLFMQIESVAGLTAAEEIAATPGVDGLFIGPADLAASLGHLGNPRHPEVREAIQRVIDVANQAGIYSGLYASSPSDGRKWGMQGATLVAIGSDVGVLQRGTRTLFDDVRRNGTLPD